MWAFISPKVHHLISSLPTFDARLQLRPVHPTPARPLSLPSRVSLQTDDGHGPHVALVVLVVEAGGAGEGAGGAHAFGGAEF